MSKTACTADPAALWRWPGRGQAAPFQLRRALAVADGAGDGHIRQFAAFVDATQHQPATAHVAAADEFAGEAEPRAEVLREDIDVFPRRDASEQDDVAIRGADRVAQL